MSEWFSFSVAKDVVLAVVAVYGSVLATFNYCQGKRKDQRNVVVDFSTVLPAYGPVLGDCFVKVAAINGGQRPVTITNIALCLPDRKRLFPIATAYLECKYPPSRYIVGRRKCSCVHFIQGHWRSASQPRPHAQHETYADLHRFNGHKLHGQALVGGPAGTCADVSPQSQYGHCPPRSPLSRVWL